VITPEPTSLTDAYALMKILSLNGFRQTARVVVNQSKNPKAAQVAFTKLKDTVMKFLGIQLHSLGTIVSDARVVEAVSVQKPFITLYPNTPAARSLKKVAENILEKAEGAERAFSLDTFWRRCADILTVPLKMPARKGDAPRQKEAAAPQPQIPTPPAADSGSEGPSHPKTTAPAGAQETTHRLLEQIVDRLSAVSRELSGIKTAIEQGSLGGFGAGSPGSGPERKSPVIPLDFEAFLAEQESAGDSGEG